MRGAQSRGVPPFRSRSAPTPQRSVGAFLIGLAVIAVLRTAWQAAWGDDPAPERDAQRDISFLP